MKSKAGQIRWAVVGAGPIASLRWCRGVASSAPAAGGRRQHPSNLPERERELPPALWRKLSHCTVYASTFHHQAPHEICSAFCFSLLFFFYRQEGIGQFISRCVSCLIRTSQIMQRNTIDHSHGRGRITFSTQLPSHAGTSGHCAVLVVHLQRLSVILARVRCCSPFFIASQHLNRATPTSLHRYVKDNSH